MSRTLLACVMLAMLAISPARADALLTLTPVIGDTVGPQSVSNPCIIAGTTCPHQGSLGYNLYSPNNDSAYDRTSNNTVANVANGVAGTPYNALALVLAAGGVSFDIAIDVNTTSAMSERLLSFTVVDTTLATTLYHYTGPTVIGTGAQNGNGFADFTLGTVNLSGIGVSPTDGILFRAQWDGAVDGSESFFIVNGSGGTVINPQCVGAVCAVPGPIVGAGLPGLLAALFGLFGLRWRRRYAV
jgi:hypothetical protein